MSRPAADRLVDLHHRALLVEEEVAVALGLTIAPRERGTRWTAYEGVHRAVQAAPALAARWEAGQALRWEIALSEQRRLRILANRMRDAEDVYAGALTSLFRAAVIWDPERASFTTLARWWMRVGVSRAADTTFGAVSITSEIRSARAMLRAHDRGQPAAELAGGRITVAQIEAARAMHCVSIDAPAPSGTANWHDMLADEDAVPVDEAVGERLDAARLCRALSKLEARRPREAQILRLVYGLDGNGNRPLRVAGATFGLSHEWARQIRKNGEEHLRAALGGE